MSTELEGFKGARVLVAGASGFVGRHLVSALAERGATVVGWGRRDHDLAIARPVLTDTWDYIFHLAAWQGGGTYAASRQADIATVNLAIIENLLAAWRSSAPRARFISLGSSCAYPSSLHAMTEDEFWNGPLHASVNGFGFAKRALQALQQMVRHQDGLRAAYLVPSTMFGEHDHQGERAHVVSALISRFIDARRNHAPEVEVWGDGSQIREFLYVGDQVRRILSAALLVDTDVLNIGSGEATSIADLAHAIARATGYEGKVRFNADRFVGNPYKVLSVAAADAVLPTMARLSLDEALRRTAASYEREESHA